jgi:ParB/RepB/Spo0J family partition protein
MTKTTADLDPGRIQEVEMQKLAVSPLNVRKDEEVGPDDELVASIRAHGLLQPLVGYIDAEDLSRVLVCAGQRRLLALRHIATPSAKIPVRIVDEETAIEVSLAENLERKNMNPVDEFAAFKALIDTGHYDAHRIASRFGFSLNLVKRRLKMALLIPEILEAVREGRITIEAAEAYAAASEEVQRDIFKKHNAKGAWEPHKPERVRSDIVLHSLAVNSRVGKFIGGLDAYLAAGGTVIDEAFLDLFKKDDDDGRMRDVSVVRDLVEKRQAELHGDVLTMVQKKYPFATGFEWANFFGNYGPDYPKPAKKSGLMVVGNGWNADAADITKRVKKAAKELGATVLAIVSIDDAGQPEIWSGKFLIGRDAWNEVKPEERTYGGYREPTPEERAAQERERKINRIATNLFGRSLVGETPGFLVTHCRVDGWGSDSESVIQVTLEKIDVPAELIDKSNHQHRISEEALKPFIEEATRIVDTPPAAESSNETSADAEELEAAE